MGLFFGQLEQLSRGESERMMTGSRPLLHPSTLNNGIIMVIEVVTGVVTVIPPEC